jgi:hypothetical protein
MEFKYCEKKTIFFNIFLGGFIMMAGKKTILVLFILMVMSMLSLAGCGGSSPTAAGGGGGGNTGPASGGGTISGFIYALSDQKKPNLSVALAGATIVANASAASTSAANGSYTISGLGGTATISAANTGYIAQTLADVPTTSGQDVHLNPLKPAPAAIASTSISGTVTTTIAGVTTPASGAVVDCFDASGNIVGWATADATGAYTMTVNFYNGVTTGNVTLMSAMVNVVNSNQIGRFGYVSVNNLTVGTPATAPVLDRTAVTTTAMTITTTNAPAGATTGTITLVMKLPTGVGVGVSTTTPGGVPTTLTAYAPNVPGVTFNAYASYNDFVGGPGTLSATAFKANIPIAATTLNLLNIPTLTSPTTIAAASPAAFAWNAVPGAAQYTVWLNQYAATRAQTYGWGGTTNLTSITKPLFAPANGGNLAVGGTYAGELSVSDAVIVGPTTNTTTAINPMIQGLSQNAVGGNLNGYVVNNPSIGANLSAAQSSAFFTVTAN